MQRAGRDSDALQLLRHAIRAVFRPCENEHRIHPRVRQQMLEQRRLHRLRDLIHKLRHRLRRVCSTPDLHRLRRLLKLMRQPLDFARQRRREHQRLPLHRQRLHDAADARQKTHVQHPVRLIQHQKLQPRKIRAPLRHQIHQPPRRRDHQVHATAQRLLLRALPYPAIHVRHPQRHMLRIGPHIFMNLHHQLPSRRQHQRPRPVLRPRGNHLLQLHQHRQRKSRRLPRPRLRNPDQVMPFDDERDRSRLNRRRLRVTCILNSL